MNRKILALCDKDNRYTCRLQEYLEEKESFPFSVSVYSDIESLSKDVKRGLISGALINDGMLMDSHEEIENIFNCENVMLMILGTGALKWGRAPIIRKYRSGETIRREILVCFSDYKSRSEKEGLIMDSSPSVAGHRETKVISAYTPIGRSLQSSFSILLGQLLSKKYPVLYLSLEPFSYLHEYTGRDGGNDITDLIYYMRSNHDRLILRLESMTENIGGLDCIPPARIFSDLQEVSGQDWIELIKTLSDCGLYEYLILDLSDAVNSLPDILRESHLIYTITRPDTVAKSKLMLYEDSLKNMEYEDVMNKTRKLEFPFFKKLPSDPSSLIESDMTGYVRELISEDFYD